MNITVNDPCLWRGVWPWPKAAAHKYNRGYLLVTGGGIAQTGAAKLSAAAALRIGAGLVSIACDRESLPVYAASLTAVMTKLVERDSDYQAFADDSHINAFLIGPGAGTGERTRAHVRIALNSGKPALLDADALTVYEQTPELLFGLVNGPAVFTPHEGEFARLFKQTGLNLGGNRVTRACEAAKLSRAIIVLKGAETVIAAPDGTCVVNRHASPYLATAGSGDVLAGAIAGLLAQGMPAFHAACAGVWLHGEAGQRFGPGLIAEDLPALIPAILHELLSLQKAPFA